MFINHIKLCVPEEEQEIPLPKAKLAHLLKGMALIHQVVGWWGGSSSKLHPAMFRKLIQDDSTRRKRAKASTLGLKFCFLDLLQQTISMSVGSITYQDKFNVINRNFHYEIESYS
ncbi:Uncharacterized protein TCM_026962 [Theobroma cacao]|uniref:Uncharacterized protein n=1 Tax=Theobroma cacao TaxID=3641 RepID=A0A061G8V2_THECC|nr:Uncharacterized protein TCM_026962 [Theobroma cacao]